MKKTCTTEQESKPYSFTEKENRYLRAQYSELVDYYDSVFPITETKPAHLTLNFNTLQAMVAMNMCFMETVRRILITRDIITKKEFNDIMDGAYEEQIKKMRKNKK